MRLWHKDLIPVLPRQQLLGQWRECCCIAKNIAENGTPNHILVNKIICYPGIDFDWYTEIVYDEMKLRGYKCNWINFAKWRRCIDLEAIKRNSRGYQIFKDWHNDKYLRQCYYNLEEKYDCGGISDEEWLLIRQVSRFYGL